MKKDRKKIWRITGKWIVKKRHGWYWTFRPSNWCYLDCCESKSEAKERFSRLGITSKSDFKKYLPEVAKDINDIVSVANATNNAKIKSK